MGKARILTLVFSIFVGLSSSVMADTIWTSGSTTLNLTPSETWYSETYSLSSSLYSAYSTGVTNPTGAFSISIPGLSIPAGSTINSATLSVNFPGAGAAGGYYFTSSGAVDPGYWYYYSCGWDTCSSWESYSWSTPSYNVSGYEYGTFSSVSSGSNSASLGYVTGGSFNLLGLGFGSDLSAGDPFTIDGTGIGYINNLSYGYYGYNSYSTTYAYANLTGTPTATLTVDYTPTPESGTLALLGMGLFGMAALIRSKLLPSGTTKS